jgi:aspartyl-tRNA(Asn)/glutamyl-tRNA(Gln) amidotransferase subunit A
VEDCALLLEVIAGFDELDPATANRSVPPYRRMIARSLRGMRIAVPTRYFAENISREIESALQQSLGVFKALGMTVVEVDLPGFDQAFDLAQVILKAEAASIHEVWIRERPEDYDFGVRSQIEVGLYIPATRYLQALRLRSHFLKEFIEKVFSVADVIHTPILRRPVPKLTECDPRTAQTAAAVMDDFPHCTRPISYLGVPALVVPCGFDSNGLPIGFQLVGRPFDEATVLNVGHMYQLETDWQNQPPPLWKSTN